jgi:aminoglycoside 2'-N-acetyltransferase I
MSEPIVVRTLATDELNAALRTSVIDLCIAANENEDFKDLFTIYIPRGGRHFLAYLGAELASHAVVTTRWAQPEGHQELRTAYVDAVATLPKFQSRGCASAAMRRLAEGIDDYEIACLETERLGFYERLGWEVWRGPLAGRSERGLVPTPDQRGVMVLRLPQTPPIDLDTAMTIECQRVRIW